MIITPGDKIWPHLPHEALLEVIMLKALILTFDSDMLHTEHLCKVQKGKANQKQQLSDYS